MKTIIIGDRGTGAYVLFRHLIFKEESKNFIVIDEIENKKYIELENKEKFKSSFCNCIENFKGINYMDIKKHADKIYINAPINFDIDYNWLLEDNDDVLRVSLNNSPLQLIKNLNKLDNIFIFNPCKDFDKEYISNIFNFYKKEIRFSTNRKGEYIMISNGEIKHSFLEFELDKNFKVEYNY